MVELKVMDLENRGVDSIIIGIDLGTTNSAVAVHSTGTVPRLCPMGTGNKTTLQSCVRWDGGDNFTVGPEAYAERYKPNVCYSVKRIMGSDEKVTFKRFNEETGVCEQKIMTPVEVSAEILKALKDRVHQFYPGLYRCVITVPAYFNQRQIEDTVSASKLAGLECVQILKEPTSASYIYSSLGYAKDGSVLIYDLGGGTFDITHMSFLRKASIPKKVKTSLLRQYNIDIDALRGADDNSLYYCRVLGTYGDTRLGGDDVDTECAKIIAERNKDWEPTAADLEELKLRCEQFKKMGTYGANINVGDRSLDISKADVDKAVERVFKKTLEIVDQIPAEELAAIKTVVLVGGSTKSDHLVDLLQQTFPDKEISRVLDPDATVALGAGAVAKDLQEGKGAAYQDVLPMAIGILENEERISVCVNKNTPLPYSTTRTFYTMHDNQSAVSVDVYQGVSVSPHECTYLGKLRVDGLPAAPAGDVKVEVAFLLNAQGRLTVQTTVDGVSEKHELIIESIFNVNTAGTASEELDEFEAAFMPLFDGREEIQLFGKRRAAIASGDMKMVERLEDMITEAV